MSVTDSSELKRQLRAAGFEIYRTAAEQVLLAERIRDNLIMDSGVAALLLKPGAVAVQVTVRAQASHFPGADETQLWARARDLADVFLQQGYDELETRAEPVPDPNDPTRRLDTSHEILLRRGVTDLESLYEQLRAALGQKRSTTDD
jgi:hypothetical protein